MIVREYLKSDKTSPFDKWLKGIDRSIGISIRARLARIEKTDNFGDVKQIKGAQNLYELRFQLGAGYRIYFGKHDQQMIILLVGGDKSSQTKDIKKAIEYWEDYLCQKDV